MVSAKYATTAVQLKPELSKGSFWQEIEAIKAEAKRLCSKNPDGSFVCKTQDRAIELREWSKRHGPYLNDSEIRRCPHEARAELAGSVEMLTQGMNIDAPDETWLWGGVLMHADSNMIVSVPKVGKTTLLVAMIAAWWNGAQSYLGQPLVGACPPVVIFGPDMSLSLIHI